MLIDDFFAESHAIMKDQQLKEIARIRNENQVEIMTLKKAVSNAKTGSFEVRTKDNHNSFKTAAKKVTAFEDNAVEADRRRL